MNGARYWYTHHPNGWVIETWRGERRPDNVYTVGITINLASAETIVNELNALYNQAMQPQ